SRWKPTTKRTRSPKGHTNAGSSMSPGSQPGWRRRPPAPDDPDYSVFFLWTVWQPLQALAIAPTDDLKASRSLASAAFAAAVDESVSTVPVLIHTSWSLGRAPIRMS